uniref:Uncharacterized protein n=1 Tax=Timema tahoe TaxID=61484 RepID=A0A7R9FFD5_9NEOP|nr:unnamed protein product [Timema tahoe]
MDEIKAKLTPTQSGHLRKKGSITKKLEQEPEPINILVQLIDKEGEQTELSEKPIPISTQAMDHIEELRHNIIFEFNKSVGNPDVKNPERRKSGSAVRAGFNINVSGKIKISSGKPGKHKDFCIKKIVATLAVLRVQPHVGGGFDSRRAVSDQCQPNGSPVCRYFEECKAWRMVVPLQVKSSFLAKGHKIFSTSHLHRTI